MNMYMYTHTHIYISIYLCIYLSIVFSPYIKIYISIHKDIYQKTFPLKRRLPSHRHVARSLALHRYLVDKKTPAPRTLQ